MRRFVVMVALASSTAAHAQPAPSKDDVEDVDSSGWTALMRAAESGQTAEITALLARGANLEASNPKVYGGATPLVIALEFAEHDAATLLLDRGAKVGGKTGTDALELAARGGLDDLVDRLLAAKVSPKGTDALELAAHYGHASTIRKLVKAGATVSVRNKSDHGYTPFIVACQNRQVDAARTLLALGANVNDVDDDGMPALHWAVFAERPDEIHMYRSLGGPHDTVYRAHPDAPLVTLLVAKRAKLEAVDADGNTALHQAAMMNAAAAATALIAAGAHRDAKNGDGKTPLELAQDRANSVEAVLRKRP
jgi:ankyrin repeat protein